MKFWIPPTFHFKKTLGLKLPAFNCALAAFSEGFGSWIKTWSKQQLTRFTWFHFTHGKTSKHYLKITRVCAADTLDMFGCLCLSRSFPKNTSVPFQCSSRTILYAVVTVGNKWLPFWNWSQQVPASIMISPCNWLPAMPATNQLQWHRDTPDSLQKDAKRSFPHKLRSQHRIKIPSIVRHSDLAHTTPDEFAVQWARLHGMWAHVQIGREHNWQLVVSK